MNSTTTTEITAGPSEAASAAIRQVEDNVFRAMSNARPVPMTNEQSKVLINLVLIPEEKAQQIVAEQSGRVFAIGMAAKRLTVFNRRMESRALLALVNVCDPPGNLVLLLSYLMYQARERDIDPITVSALCDVFPWGFFSEADTLRFWDAQKSVDGRCGDNLLDSGSIVDWLNSPKPCADRHTASDAGAGECEVKA